MKQQLLNGIIMLWVALLVSCRNTAIPPESEAKATTDSMQVTLGEQPLLLPALKGEEKIVFEDDNVRIVQGETIHKEASLYNTLTMQPKNASYKQFSIEGRIFTFEGVVGEAVLASEGAGAVRILWVYDLTTGEELAQIYSFHDRGIKVESDHQFSFYRYDDDNPQVSWNEKKHEWENRNEVPNKLQNTELEEVKKEAQTDLFDGLTLMAQRRVLVDIQTGEITPLDEYKWDFIE